MAEYLTNESGSVMELKDGQWVKVPQIKNEQDGSILFKIGDEWQPAPRRVQEGLIKSEKAKLVDRALKIGMNPKDLFVEPHTETEAQLAGLDKGFEDTYYGANQLLQHMVPGKDTTAIDETVREREEYAPNNLGQFTGSVAGMLGPGGLGVRTARSVPILAKTGLIGEGVVGGALEGATMPVTGDNFAADKAMQVGGTATLSGGVATGIRAATRSGEAAVNVGRHAENLPGQLSARQVQQGSEMATEGRRLADEFDVPLTPGQSSDSATLKFLEQRARQSWLSREAALEGDVVRSQKMREAIEQQAGDVDSAQFASRMQRRISSFVRDLAKNRSKNGRANYGAIDKAAGGEKIVQPKALRDELLKIIEEAGTQEGGDVVAAAAQARKMLANIDAQGGYTAQEALGRLQNWSPYSKGTVFDDVSKGYDSVLKRRIYGAIMEDMSATEAAGGNIGEMVKRANTAWRKATENIDSVHKSALGKMVGEDVASDLFNFNTIAPEQLMDKLSRLRPSQAKAAVRFMTDHMPEMLPEMRGAILRDAIDASMEMAATAGSKAQFNPGNFLRALGLTGGKRGAESTSRLMAYFGGSGSKEWKVMSDLVQLSRRLADVSGKNFSGTAAANQFFDVIRRGFASGGNFLGAVGGTALEGVGLKRVTQSMNPGHELFGGFNARPLLQAPRVIQKAPLPAGLAAPAVVNELDTKPNR